MFDTFFRETYILKSYKFSGPTSPFIRYNSYMCVCVRVRVVANYPFVHKIITFVVVFNVQFDNHSLICV